MVTIRSRERRAEGGGPGGSLAGVGAPARDDAEPAGQTGTSAVDGQSDGNGASRPGTASPEGAPDEAPEVGQEADGNVVNLTFGQEEAPWEEPRARPGRRGTRAGVRIGRPRPPSSEDEKPKAGASKRSDFRLDKAAVSALLDIVDAMTSAQLGDRAKFNARERGLIEPSLTRIVARMTPDAAAKFSQLADPLMLATGLLLWGVRVFGGDRSSEGTRPPTPLRPQPVPREAPAEPRVPGPIDPGGVAPPPDHLADVWAATSP